ncbi:2-hydroxy-acid oxidase [Virgibacillus phasianinus]|uniref:D-lactate dehydrogenase (cytochrome) n=1 Tax=Virgibacillus phasianinus TaxID=2017483 RepID=A0A220U1J3_9BACI|nr:FAD-linked oxidase C-terminal domain-containing protein [Virgibacillus phasianinus]ASK61882.1 2-hydroxy-acid oxidase [Virgibacillus phasianinus]
MYIKQLIEAIGSNKVSQNETELYRHSHDESPHKAIEPEVVCFPDCKNDIIKIIEIAREHHVPVTAFGAGSGLEGQAIPVHRGITLNFENMNDVVDFSPDDLTITVQPGLTRLQLNKLVNRHGLMFPIDPGADATIGGMVATNASGTTAVRYGSMRDQLLDLEVVLADGTVIHTGSHAKKSSSGYNLTSLFAGSEGTLGIITKVTLRLHGIPEYTMAARCTFDSPENCAKAAQAVLLSGIPVMRMELVDAQSVSQVNMYGGYDYPVKHSLFFEFAGLNSAVEEEIKLAKDLMYDLGCQDWKAASDSRDQKELWKARHELSYAYSHVKGMKDTGADVCVPISHLPELVVYARELIEQSGLEGGILGHVGDGNFHTIVVFDPSNPGEQEKAEYTNEALARRAIEVGGTCTGEHGVGLGKMKFQNTEHGAAVGIMKGIKQLLDPKGLLNPGKIFP